MTTRYISDRSPFILKLAETCRRTGKSRSAVYADISAGSFPSPVRIGRRAVGWLESEINEWIRVRAAQRSVRFNQHPRNLSGAKQRSTEA